MYNASFSVTKIYPNLSVIAVPTVDYSNDYTPLVHSLNVVFLEVLKILNYTGNHIKSV